MISLYFLNFIYLCLPKHYQELASEPHGWESFCLTIVLSPSTFSRTLLSDCLLWQNSSYWRRVEIAFSPIKAIGHSSFVFKILNDSREPFTLLLPTVLCHMPLWVREMAILSLLQLRKRALMWSSYTSARIHRLFKQEETQWIFCIEEFKIQLWKVMFLWSPN